MKYGNIMQSKKSKLLISMNTGMGKLNEIKFGQINEDIRRYVGISMSESAQFRLMF
jgi:hypothetical protein